MAEVLISFIGRSKRSEGGGGYQLANYRFDSGFRASSSFFAHAALFEARSLGRPFERLIFLGTSTSTWDDVALSLGAGEDAFVLAEMLELEQKKAGARPESLERLGTLLSRTLGCEIECLALPQAKTVLESQQIAVLLAGRLRRKDRLTIDITHALRHLPILTLFASLASEGMGIGRIVRIVSGVYELSHGGETPVFELGGVTSFAQWVRALAIYDHSGAIAPLGHLVEEDTGIRLELDFERADFMLRTFRTEAAVPVIRKLARVIERAEGPVTSLFRDALLKRFRWARESTLAHRQAALARQYLSDKRYVEAIILGFEAALSFRIMDMGLDPERTKGELGREKLQAAINEQLQSSGHDDMGENDLSEAWIGLKAMRNTIAHVVTDTGHRVEQRLASADRLEAALKMQFDTLFR